MYIKEVSLQGFRNLEPLHIAPTAGMNLFYGDNAQGKNQFSGIPLFLCPGAFSPWQK